MITVKSIFDLLCDRYPLETACDFDNPGLLVGDGQATVTKALVALDCDIDAVSEAKRLGCELIVTHHPVIWEGLKSVTAGSVVFELIKSGISVISMHTNLDIASDGVNRTLCETIGLKNIESFTALDGFPLLCGDSPAASADDLAERIKQSLGFNVRYAGSDREIKRVLVCCGSGGEFLEDAKHSGFDALITADVKHNVFIDAVNYGISVFDAGHFASERVIVKPLARLLEKNFIEAQFIPFESQKIKSV